MTAAQLSPTIRSPRLSPTSAPTQRPAPAPIQSPRLAIIPTPPNSSSFTRRAREAQKALRASPLFATLTHSLSRKSFACHSYANTRDGRAAPSPIFSSALVYPLALTTFRINTCKSVSKQTTLTSFRMNTCKKRGEGGGIRTLSDNPT